MLNLNPLPYPSQEKRLNSWSNLYKSQGHRWGFLPSLTAHLALADIYRFNKKGIKLLDLGCGYCRDLYLFSLTFSNITLDGLDWSSQALELTKGFYPLLRLRQFYNINIFDYFNNNCTSKYDVIYTNYFFHLFNLIEISEIVDLIKMNLNKNGIFISSFISRKDRHYGKGKKLGENVYEVYKGIPWHFFSEKDLFNICSSKKLNVITIKEYSEIELVKGNPDPVEGIYLAANI